MIRLFQERKRLGMHVPSTVSESRPGPTIACWTRGRRWFSDTRPALLPDEDAGEFHRELWDQLEQMLLQRIFYEFRGKPEHGSRERLFENKVYQGEAKAEGDAYFWPKNCVCNDHRHFVKRLA
jgi:hypothetical protein